VEFRHIRYFFAVSVELNFGRAAERLHLAQPALSAQIKRLEEELGARLFERTTRVVSLTASGAVFLEKAREIVVKASLATEAVRKANSGQVGTLRFGVITLAVSPKLAQVLRNFHQRYPEVQITLSDQSTAEQYRSLAQGELDIGVLRPPVENPALEWRDWEETYRVLAAPSGHRLARKRVLEWKDFDGEGLVMIQSNSQYRFYDEFLNACSQAGARVHPAQYAKDISSLLWLISAGFGVAPTTAVVSRIRLPGLVFRPLPPGIPPVKTVFAWRRDAVSPALKNFLNCLGSHFPASSRSPS